MTGDYDDIISLPHPTSSKHPRMSPMDRAAQFSPFAALSGHGAAIRETARLTDQRIELDEMRKAELDERLRYVAAHPSECPIVTITYFRADEKKSGGSYVTVTGAVKRMEDVARTILLTDGTQIPVDDIYNVESDCLHSLLLPVDKPEITQNLP